MEHNISCTWTGKMSFEAEADGHIIPLDAEVANGGDNKGPRPKILLLVSLAGCTGMDVIAILQKMKVDVKDYKMSVKGNTVEEHPKVYETIHITFEFWGSELPLDKIEKAIGLSKERYCGVNAMLGKSAKITYDIVRHEG
jgi:putative redox protein